MDFENGLKNSGRPLDNHDLYKGGIIYGLATSEINAALTRLESEGKIVVNALPGRTRRGKAFYISNSNYKEYPKINVSWVGK